MKMLPTLSSVPELRRLDQTERGKIILQWRREAKPWSGYLFHVGFCVFVMLSITLVPLIAFERLRDSRVHEWIFPALIGIGAMPAQILYDRGSYEDVAIFCSASWTGDSCALTNG